MKAIICACVLAVGVLSAADLSGTWKGAVSANAPEGGNRTDTTILILKQDGDKLTGTVGERDDDQRAIQNGKVSGDQVTFEVTTDNSVFKADLKRVGDALDGLVTREREGQTTTFKLALKREAGDVTGTWSGSLEPQNSDPAPLQFIFKQSGRTLTGSGGPDPSKQLPIENGIVDGNQLTFEIHHEKGLLRFDLKAEGDQITGKGTRTRDGEIQTAKVSAKRVKP